MNDLTIAATPAPSPNITRAPARWPLILLALPAGVATWSGWVGLGRFTGFGVVTPLPGILDNFEINSAIVLPIGVEAYAAYALGTWLSHHPMLSTGTRRFAGWSALGSLLLGMLGQIAYHLLEVAGAVLAPWQVTTAVSCLPVLVLGMGAGLGHMIAHDVRAVPERSPVDALFDIPAAVPDRVEETIPAEADVVTEASTPAVAEAPEPTVVEAPETPVPGPVAVVPPQASSPDPEALPAPILVAPGPVFSHQVQAGTETDDADPLGPAALSRYLPNLVEGDIPTVRTIKDEMSVGTDRARRLQAYLSQLVDRAVA